ncbi:hypothetical protein C3941_09290 [Kaistia algarum]|uniref:hypothetical protein n=1 Tax=Kaistia algarum TaxID=2083279 RepID=UPI000CE8C4B5|nr:hypothetical protein [Kaistia algarum]MCX5512253.1 hypothetical protein [Kaistia algarum]PPE80344.1 hypothetical protein C3941_09290 [Kaistia algarum]
MSVPGLYWRPSEARLKSFSIASAKVGSVLKIELHVTDALRLGMLLQDLAETQRDQDAPARSAPKRPAGPLLLTDRRDHDRSF